MLTRLFVIFFICMSIIQFIQAHHDYYSEVHKRENRKYCGSRLVAALQLVCNGVYNSMFKKSLYSDDVVHREWEDDRDNPVMYPFKSRVSASTIFPGTFRRTLRGANDECCKKSCNYRELAGYCGRR